MLACFYSVVALQALSHSTLMLQIFHINKLSMSNKRGRKEKRFNDLLIGRSNAERERCLYYMKAWEH